MLNLEAIAPESLRLWTRREYEQMVELGFFDEERLELLRGVIVHMSPQGAPHAYVIRELNRIFFEAVGRRAAVQVQSPLALSEESEPEPDIALVAPNLGPDEHPRTAYLVVEVAATSQRKDRAIKGPLYAEAGIGEYWLVDLEARAVEVHTQPSAGAYQRCVAAGREGAISLSAFPEVTVSVADFLP